MNGITVGEQERGETPPYYDREPAHFLTLLGKSFSLHHTPFSFETFSLAPPKSVRTERKKKKRKHQPGEKSSNHRRIPFSFFFFLLLPFSLLHSWTVPATTLTLSFFFLRWSGCVLVFLIRFLKWAQHSFTRTVHLSWKEKNGGQKEKKHRHAHKNAEIPQLNTRIWTAFFFFSCFCSFCISFTSFNIRHKIGIVFFFIFLTVYVFRSLSCFITFFLYLLAF